ncbi:MAG: OmpA family protein [Treponema sp.]|nr:OmpA family protein [Treponema sp.]
MNNKQSIILCALILALGQLVFAEDETPKMALGIGPEVNMNTPVNFAGGLALGFDYNLPITAAPFAAGVTITGSYNFSDIFVAEFSGLFRWYFLGRGFNGWFAQVNLGGNVAMAEGAPLPLVAELRAGYRVPLGKKFYVEPYGRAGYPAVWGLGVMAGIRFSPKKPEAVERPTRERDTRSLAARIAAIFGERDIQDTTVEVTDEGIRVSFQNIQFLPDSAELQDSELPKINEMAEILRSLPGVRIQIAGHTALADTEESRMRVSLERATGIADYLVGLEAISADNITTVGYGADRPIADNATPEGMAANRRIEITILED